MVAPLSIKVNYIKGFGHSTNVMPIDLLLKRIIGFDLSQISLACNSEVGNAKSKLK